MSVRVSWRKESDSYMKEHACERDGRERRFKYLVACIENVNIKGIQFFEFEMMIHTRTKIDLSNMHTQMNSHASMLFNM